MSAIDNNTFLRTPTNLIQKPHETYNDSNGDGSTGYMSRRKKKKGEDESEEENNKLSGNLFLDFFSTMNSVDISTAIKEDINKAQSTGKSGKLNLQT